MTGNDARQPIPRALLRKRRTWTLPSRSISRTCAATPWAIRGLELEILGLFVEQLPITIGALEHAPTDKEWGMAAHTLKGSARAVGAWPLAALAEDAERLHGLPDADAGMRAAIFAASRRPPERRAHTSPRWPAPT